MAWRRLLGRKPKDLSGGQQQRVAIGRAIIRQPSVFLFDEPLSNLDAKLRVETRTELLQIQRRLGITCLYVTHDQEEAMTLSDRMVVMRDGRTAQEGTPLEVYDTPRDTFVAAFVGSPKMNLLDGELTGETFTLPSGFGVSVERVKASGTVTLGVRPDDLVPTPADDADARVKLIELLGPEGDRHHRRPRHRTHQRRRSVAAHRHRRGHPGRAVGPTGRRPRLRRTDRPTPRWRHR